MKKVVDYNQKLIHLFESLNGIKPQIKEGLEDLNTTEGLEDLNTTVDNPSIVRDIPDSPFAQEPNISVNPDGAGNPNPSLPESEIDKLNNHIRRQAQYLKVGDVLYSSGAKVIVAPSRGIKTPTGKIDIVVEYPNGRKSAQQWGRYTVVGIRPPETPMVAEDQINVGDGDQEPMNNYTPPMGLGQGMGESKIPDGAAVCPFPIMSPEYMKELQNYRRLAGIKKEEENGNTDYNEGTPTNPDNDITEPKPRI
jgi:hypothetical protein